MNLLLHIALDTAMTAARGGHDPVGDSRYADNVLVVTRTATEGRDALEWLRELLADVGLTLKGALAPHGTCPAGTTWTSSGCA